MSMEADWHMCDATKMSEPQQSNAGRLPAAWNNS